VNLVALRVLRTRNASFFGGLFEALPVFSSQLLPRWISKPVAARRFARAASFSVARSRMALATWLA
jgi:hypothetical protein